MFDLITVVAFVVAALFFQTKAAAFFAVEKAFSLALILAFIGINHTMYHLIFAAESLIFAAFLNRILDGCHILKLTVALLSFLHSFVAISYYLFSYEFYLTVYNLYPTGYLILIALQIIGLWHGSNRQRIFFNWHECAAHFDRPSFLVFTTCYQRVKKQ